MTETMESIVAETRKVASENPAFVYQAKREHTDEYGPRCMYQEADGSDGCIFGHVFKRLNLMTALLGQFPDQRASITIALQALGFIQSQNDKRLATWCAYVQSAQDDETAWGSAIEFADKHVPIAGLLGG